jgi:orotate phosphoribosyltransferase-like protein
MNGNYEYFMKNDFSRYEGKWVVIVNKRVVATGNNIKKMLEKVKKEFPTSEPFLAKIPSKRALII